MALLLGCARVDDPRPADPGEQRRYPQAEATVDKINPPQFIHSFVRETSPIVRLDSQRDT